MSSLEKWFPVVLALPFFLSTTMLEVLRLPSELGRWLVLATALVLAYLRGFKRGPRGRLGLVGADFSALIVLLFFGASALWAFAPAYSFQRTISLSLLYGTAFWWSWGYADRFGEGRLLRLFLRTAAVILGVNLLVFGSLAPGEIIARRFQGFFENPNNLGMICSISLPLAFASLLRKRRKWELVFFGIFFLTLLACGSRTGLVSAIVGMTIIGGLRGSRGNRTTIGMGFLFAVVIVILPFTEFFKENIVRERSLETFSNRTFFWELAKERYIPAHPWAGHGFGTDGLIHDHYRVVLSDLKLRGYGVMSSYFGLAVAVGIPGAIIFFALVMIPTLTGLVRYWKDPQLVALAAAVVSGLLVGITESAIYAVGNCFCYLFWICFALMIRRLVYRQRGIRLNQDGALTRPRKRKATRKGRSRGSPSPQPTLAEPESPMGR